MIMWQTSGNYQFEELDRAKRHFINPQTKELLHHPLVGELIGLAAPGEIKVRTITAPTYDHPRLDRYAD